MRIFRAFCLAILVFPAFGITGCQQPGPLRVRPIAKKSTACAGAQNLVAAQNHAATTTHTAWERSFKTYSQIGQYFFQVESFFSLTGTLSDYRPSYESLWNSIQIRPEKLLEIDRHVGRIVLGYPRYRAVSITQRVPWWFIGIVHGLEGGYNFETHLHNGDPLTGRTVRVPEGRPKTGRPPFLWEESAKDAMGIIESLSEANWKDPAAIAYEFESYNGFGYRSKGIHSPYLWSYSNHYSRGKYIADGEYSSYAVSEQAGAMVILKRAINRGIVNVAEINSPPPPKVQQQAEETYGNLPPLGKTEDDDCPE